MASHHYLHVFGRVGSMLFIGTRHSISDVCTLNRSKVASQEQNIFDSTGWFDDTGFGTFGGRRSSNVFRMHHLNVFMQWIVCFIRLLIINPYMLYLFLWSFIERFAENPAEKLVWINAVTAWCPLRSYGILQNGLPFYIYIFHLYQDGFNQKNLLEEKMSVLSAYMLPVSQAMLPKSWAAIGGSNFCRDVQSANYLIKIILDDIENFVANGIEYQRFRWAMRHISRSNCSHLGPGPTLKVLTDSMGHYGVVCFSFCVFPRSKCSAADRSFHKSKLLPPTDVLDAIWCKDGYFTQHRRSPGIVSYEYEAEA